MSDAEEIVVCGLSIRPHEHVVAVQGREVDLTSREFEIVRRLAEHPGWVYSAEQLAVGDVEADFSPESVSVLISRLRQKLEQAGGPDVVETVRGFGYRLHVGECAEEALVTASSGTLREAAWNLQATVVEVDHAGTDEQRESAARVLEQARRSIYAVLANGKGEDPPPV